jgi:acyl-coenzyme A thioesterase PaaI-like protein
MNTTFLARVEAGEALVIEGNITQLASAVAFGEATAVRRDSGELVAQARVTFAIQQERP